MTPISAPLRSKSSVFPEVNANAGLPPESDRGFELTRALQVGSARGIFPAWRAVQLSALLTAVLLASTHCVKRASADDSAVPPPEFHGEVLPVLTRYCTGCHNPEDAEGKLVLESYPALLEGGQHGAVVAPGSAETSRLILVLEGKAEPAMPPEGNPRPSQEEVALLKRWIDAGARGPSGGANAPRRLVVPHVDPTVAPRQPITAAQYSPDGKFLAVALQRDVWLLDAASRGLLRKFNEHAGAVGAVCFSPDGRRLAVAAGEPGRFGELKLWDVENGTLVRSFEGHRDCLYAVAFSPDQTLLATAGYDAAIQLWNLDTGEPVRTLEGHSGAVFALSFRKDGKVLASASADRTVKLWDVATAERLDTLGQSTKELYCVAVSDDGSRVAAAGADNRIRVWQLSPSAKEGSNPLLDAKFAHQAPIIQLAYSADGKSLISSAEDRTVRIWESSQLAQKVELESQPDWPSALALDRKGTVLFVGRMDGTYGFYSPRDGKPLPPPAPSLIALSRPIVERGTTVRLSLRGRNLVGIERLETNHSGLVATLLPATEPNAEVVEVEISSTGDIPLGKYNLVAVTAGGKSGQLAVEVDRLPQLAEAERADPSTARSGAIAVSLPAVIHGSLSERGEVDEYRFEAQAGETIVFDVKARRAGSEADAVLTVSDSHGRVLAHSNDDPSSPDPFLALTIPSDGTYFVRINDLMRAGSAKHTYQLLIGAVPYVTGIFPLSVPSDTESSIELVGFNLPAEASVTVPAAPSGELSVPLDAERYRWRRSFSVLVGSFPELIEQEPNDEPEAAQAISIPATVGGRLWSESRNERDVDLYRFSAKAGETWIIETDAARRGSPVDTYLEVLDLSGQPIERLLLEAVRDSQVTFRPINSVVTDVRTTNWEEMELNQYLYLQGEVCRLFRLPQGPDSGFVFYNWQGKRICYFDTSATSHAVDEACYIVRPHPPGTSLAANGLPVFPIYFANDDDGQRKLGRDSQVTFTAPRDGDYLVRVLDVRGQGGREHAYRLTLRRPQPDFSVSIAGLNPSLPAAGGRKLTFTADRRDGFDGEIRIEIAGLPEGIHAATPVIIEAGHTQSATVVYADQGAKSPGDDQLRNVALSAHAIIDGSPVVRELGGLGSIKVVPRGKLVVRLEPAEVTVAPGGTVTAELKIERHGIDAPISFEVNHLPHGVIVDNIGLNGVLIPEGQTQRTLYFTARDWVVDATRAIHAVAVTGGGEASSPITFHVRRPSPLARADEQVEPAAP